MFINCPFCKALIATDPATDLPPEHCPRCAARLRGEPMETVAPTASTILQGDARIPPLPTFEMPFAATPAETPPAAAATPQLAASELSARIRHAVAVEPAPKPDAPIAATPVPAAPDPGQPTSPDDGTPAAAPASETATQAPSAPAPPPDPAPAPAEPSTPSPAAAPPAATRALPSFAHGRRGQGSGLGWASGGTIVALALLLALQLLLADRARLAGDARWRPLLANVCGVLGCALPAWREPTAFTVLARDVRPNPAVPGTLRVTATFRNDARWTQAWPRIRLTLSDINGSTVAARDFGARDYLGDPPTQSGLRSGQSASIAMDVVEPAARSVAFDFELH